MINYLITPSPISDEDLPDGIMFSAEIYDQDDEDDEE